MAKYKWREKRGPKKITFEWETNPVEWINQHSAPTVTTTGTGQYTIDWQTMPTVTLPDPGTIWTTSNPITFSGAEPILNTVNLRGISADMVVIDELNPAEPTLIGRPRPTDPPHIPSRRVG